MRRYDPAGLPFPQDMSNRPGQILPRQVIGEVDGQVVADIIGRIPLILHDQIAGIAGFIGEIRAARPTRARIQGLRKRICTPHLQAAGKTLVEL